MYNNEQIPNHTEYYKKLQSFRSSRQEEIRERFPQYKRLTIPGRIIHLKHGLDDGGNLTKQKFIPYWESRDTFNELTLNLTATQEHSIGNLSHHLNKIAQEYESGVNVHCHFSGLESAHTSYSPTQEDQEYIVEDEGWFVLCSMPRGLATLIPALLAFLAILLSMIGHNSCDMTARNVEGLYFNTTESSRVEVTTVTLGLYSYGFEYYSDVDNTLSHQCSLHSPHKDPNLFLRVARVSATLAVFVGLWAVGFLAMAQHMNVRNTTFVILSICLMISALCESLVLLLLKSSACYTNPDKLTADVELDPCSLDTGSSLVICAALLWLLAAAFTVHASASSVRLVRSS